MTIAALLAFGFKAGRGAAPHADAFAPALPRSQPRLASERARNHASERAGELKLDQPVAPRVLRRRAGASTQKPMALRAARALAPRAAQAAARRSMATEKEIAMRIASTKNIRKITSSMKMVSAAKLKGDQNRLAAAKQFAAWTAVLDEPATPLEELEGTAGLADHSVVVAISSDKGLCGGVHSAVARGLRTINARLKEENKTMNVIAVGEKGRSQLRRMVPDSLTTALTNIPPPYNFGYASTVAQMALDTEPEKTGAIAGCGLQQVCFRHRLLADPENDRALRAGRRRRDLNGLRRRRRRAPGIPRCYLATEIFYGMMEGATSEQSSRMQAMENATKNAGELIDKLTLIYNRASPGAHHDEAHRAISGASALDEEARA